jgi:glycosyltransferase involved in cell wall biosynthesis
MADVGFSSLGLAIGLPFCGRPTTPLWGVALATQTFPLNTAVTHVVVQQQEVGEARNQIVDWALEHNSTYVMFVDDDVILPPFAIQRLGYAMDTYAKEKFPDDKVVAICGVYMSKEEMTTPVIYRKNGQGGSWDWKFNDVFKIESGGTGCMLIRTEVFKHLEKPYFKTVQEYVYENDSVGCKKITDDIYFCNKVNAAGFSILAHGGVLCGHYDVRKDKIFTMPDDAYPVKDLKKEETAKV